MGTGATRIRYLSIDEMLVRIDELRGQRAAERAQQAHAPDWVSAVEALAEAEAANAAWMRPPAPQAGDGYVWIGDDMAVRLDSPELLDLDARLAGYAAGWEHRPEPEPWRDAPRGFIAKWGLERYAIGAVAIGIIALLVAGTSLWLGPSAVPQHEMAQLTGLVAGHDPQTEVVPDENLTPAMYIVTDVAAPVHHRLSADQLEERVHHALDSQGFWDIGVSAGSLGDVYLAGDVYSKKEVKSVLDVARNAARAARVFFPHPDVHPAQGPAYFGAVPEYSPAVWGAQVTDVVIGSPAYMAGVRPGDIIREFDYKTVTTAAELRAAVAAHQPGERVEIRVWRDGGNQFLTARLGSRPHVVVTQVAMR